MFKIDFTLHRPVDNVAKFSIGIMYLVNELKIAYGLATANQFLDAKSWRRKFDKALFNQTKSLYRVDDTPNPPQKRQKFLKLKAFYKKRKEIARRRAELVAIYEVASFNIFSRSVR
jgi:hypothetical protein